MFWMRHVECRGDEANIEDCGGSNRAESSSDFPCGLPQGAAAALCSGQLMSYVPYKYCTPTHGELRTVWVEPFIFDRYLRVWKTSAWNYQWEGYLNAFREFRSFTGCSAFFLETILDKKKKQMDNWTCYFSGFSVETDGKRKSSGMFSEFKPKVQNVHRMSHTCMLMYALLGTL